jgi:transcriptional regulator GlxA family with amidase domain
MLRVGAAKELLERGAESIQTVCSKIGYADVAFCRTLFKRHTGMTPAEYRSRFAQMVFDRGGPIEEDDPAAQQADVCGA